jgi:hypothetical protein
MKPMIAVIPAAECIEDNDIQLKTEEKAKALKTAF